MKYLEVGKDQWQMVDTDYRPAEKSMNSITLADEVSMKKKKYPKFPFLELNNQ